VMMASEILEVAPLIAKEYNQDLSVGEDLKFKDLYVLRNALLYL